MPRQIEYVGQVVVIGDYLPAHYLSNQREWAAEGIPLNPCMRSDFDTTPNEHRDPLEVDHWWGVPYITTTSWGDMSQGAPADDLEERRRRWFEAWPEGVRYCVRCLDGGAWDRSTNMGMVATLDEAISRAVALRAEF